MIEVRGLSKVYRSLYAIEDVTFGVKQGEIVGFLGPNGAGKTTTMKILTCFMPPTSGTAEISGLDVLREPLAVRRLIGYLPESSPLYPEMSPISYLKFIGRARGLDRATLKKRLEYVISATGLEKVLHKEVSELSKGFRQRVCLAQALLHDPPILILDEPTTGLDPLQRIEIRDLIKGIGHQKTVILSTHILSEAEATCDKLVIISKGKIVADGTAEELISAHTEGGSFSMVIRSSRNSAETAFSSNPIIASYKYEGSAGEGLVRFTIVPKAAGLGSGEDLYRMARELGWSLAELSYNRTTLEDVFRKLTGGLAETKEVAA